MARVLTYVLMSAMVVGVAAAPALVRADDKDDGSTTLRLNAEARRSVPQDRLQVTLAFEQTAKTAAEAQKLVNAKMRDALKVYGGVSSVKATTGNYNVWKQYPNEPGPKPLTDAEREKAATWQATQQLMLDSADKDATLALVGKLQEQGFNVQNMNFYLSRQASDALRDDLTVEALGTMKARAQKMAGALGMKSIRFATIDVTGNPVVPPMPMMRAMAMKADSAGYAEPVGQAGESEVVVNVNAEVKLSN